MQYWKLLGVAGLLGLGATVGTVIVRRRRPTVPIEPESLRARLHERLAAAEAASRP